MQWALYLWLESGKSKELRLEFRAKALPCSPSPQSCSNLHLSVPILHLKCWSLTARQRQVYVSSFVSAQIPRLEICKLALIALVWVFSSVRLTCFLLFSTVSCAAPCVPVSHSNSRPSTARQLHVNRMATNYSRIQILIFTKEFSFEHIVWMASAAWSHDHHLHLTWLSFIPSAPSGAEVGEDEWLCDTCRPLSSALGKQNNCQYFLLLCLEM